MISQLFLLSPRGDTIIFKDFRSNIPKVGAGCPQLLPPGSAPAACRLPSCCTLPAAPFPSPSSPCLDVQTSTEVFFRKATFWDGTGKDAPPAFHVDGVQYLHVKVGWVLAGGCCGRSAAPVHPKGFFCRRHSCCRRL